MKGRINQQVPMPELEQSDLHAIAASKEKFTYVLIDEILERYFKTPSINRLHMLATPDGGKKNFNLWLTFEHMEKIKEFALEHDCSGNRVIYSALKYWLMRHSLTNKNKTVFRQ